MEKDAPTQHISRQFNEELERIRSLLLEMGGMVERQVTDAVQSLMEADSSRAEQVRRNDVTINSMEMRIDEECIHILARRQPAASDLRLVVAITKSITDLERIGDEARKIAEQSILLAQEGKRELVTYMMEDSRSISRVLNVMWSLRSLERVGDHARNLSEYVIYLVKGEDVRHMAYQDLASRIKEH